MRREALGIGVGLALLVGGCGSSEVTKEVDPPVSTALPSRPSPAPNAKVEVTTIPPAHSLSVFERPGDTRGTGRVIVLGQTVVATCLMIGDSKYPEAQRDDSMIFAQELVTEKPLGYIHVRGAERAGKEEPLNPEDM